MRTFLSPSASAAGRSLRSPQNYYDFDDDDVDDDDFDDDDVGDDDDDDAVEKYVIRHY